MFRIILFLSAFSMSVGAAWAAADVDVRKAHDQFVDAFNNRDWDAVKRQLAGDIVFHRASGDTVYIGPDAVTARFSETIGNPGQWNVKFAILQPDSQFEGNDGRVVERGDFAVTAGADSDSCYRGSYMMTWVKAEADWRLQMFAWQDVETDIENCQ